jgi:hypothetical protein
VCRSACSRSASCPLHGISPRCVPLVDMPGIFLLIVAALGEPEQYSGHGSRYGWSKRACLSTLRYPGPRKMSSLFIRRPLSWRSK